MSIDERMAELRQRFIVAADRHADQIEAQLARGDLEAARQLAHGLAGRAGMFGFDELGEIARDADEADGTCLRERAGALLAALRQVAQEA